MRSTSASEPSLTSQPSVTGGVRTRVRAVVKRRWTDVVAGCVEFARGAERLGGRRAGDGGGTGRGAQRPAARRARVRGRGAVAAADPRQRGDLPRPPRAPLRAGTR